MYLEKLRLDNKISFITGAGQGIGASCARALGEAGSTVIIADLDTDKINKSVEELTALGIKADGVELNVIDSSRVAEVANMMVKKHQRIDVLVNNAGVAVSDVKAEDTTDKHWRMHMDVNVDGLFWCCREFGKKMLIQGSGSIINIGSMSGLIVNKPQPQSFYNASKAAVHQLTKSLAAEWGAKGIRVNAVAPTYIATPLTKFGMEENPEMYQQWLDLTPMGRVGTPEEVASIVHFLASDAASLMTGAIVNADAGYTCW